MKKKLISIIVLTTLLCMVGFGNVVSAENINDDFTWDELENNWTVTKSTENNGTNYSFKDVNKVLSLQAVLDGAQTATRKNFKTTSGDVQAFWGTVYVDMVFSLSGITSTQRIFRLQADSTGNRWTTGLVINDNRLYYENVGTGEKIAVDTDFRFEANRDYNMRISTHMKPGANGAINPVGTAGTYDISIDGKTIATGLPNVHGCQNTQQFLLFQSGEGNWDFKKIAISDSYNGSWTAADITEEYSEIDSLSSEDWVFAALGDNASSCSGGLTSKKIPTDLALCLDAKSAPSAATWICAKKTFNAFSSSIICIDMDFVIKGSGTVDLRFLNDTKYVLSPVIKKDGKLYYRDWQGKEIETDITITKDAKHNMKIYYDLTNSKSAITYLDGKKTIGMGIYAATSQTTLNKLEAYVFGNAEFDLDTFSITNVSELPSSARVEAFSVTDKATGNEISSLSDGLTVNVTSTVANALKTTIKPAMFVALYDGERLVNVICDSAEVVTREKGNLSAELALTNITNASNLRVFIWDGNGLKPLCSRYLLDTIE